MRYRWVVFDLDGTLVDSDHALIAPYLRLGFTLDDVRLGPLLAEECQRLGITMEDAAHILSAIGNVRISQAAFANYNVTVRTEFPKSIDRRGRLAGYAG